MNGRWAMKLQAWPYSTGNGRDADRAAAGPHERSFEFRAADFDDAYAKAKLIQQGVLSHDRVYKAPILSLDYLGERP